MCPEGPQVELKSERVLGPPCGYRSMAVAAKMAKDMAKPKRMTAKEKIALELSLAGPPHQGLTLVHFSAQPEPFLTQNTS